MYAVSVMLKGAISCVISTILASASSVYMAPFTAPTKWSFVPKSVVSVINAMGCFTFN